MITVLVTVLCTFLCAQSFIKGFSKMIVVIGYCSWLTAVAEPRPRRHIKQSSTVFNRKPADDMFQTIELYVNNHRCRAGSDLAGWLAQATA
jgi:hypothetical protein